MPPAPGRAAPRRLFRCDCPYSFIRKSRGEHPPDVVRALRPATGQVPTRSANVGQASRLLCERASASARTVLSSALPTGQARRLPYVEAGCQRILPTQRDSLLLFGLITLVRLR